MKEYLAHTAPALFYTPFHRLELRTAIRLRAFRQKLPLNDMRSALRDLDADVADGILQHTPLVWADALREAERLGEAHATEIGTRSGDLLHVASAVVLGAREFVTFDLRQSEMAKRAGLKVKTWKLA
jgi:hypothetical protein